MAASIEGVETEDPARASRHRGEMRKNNEEDLDAMRFGYQWIAVNSREPVGE
jgi:hypothetical protein